MSSLCREKSGDCVVTATEHLKDLGVRVRQQLKLLWSYDTNRAWKGKDCVFLAAVKWWKQPYCFNINHEGTGSDSPFYHMLGW